MKNSKINSVINLFSEKRVTTVAGAWVYFFLTSLIPLAFLLVTAFSIFGVSITDDLVSRLPEEFRLAGETIARTAENASGGVTVFFIFTVIFSATTLLNQMSKDGDFLYGVQSASKRGIMRRLWAVVALSALFLLFLGLAFLFAFKNSIGVNFTGRSEIFLTTVAILFVILFGYAIILILNGFISPIKLKFSQMAIGSLLSLFIMVLGTIGFIVYLRFFSNYNAFYGALSGIIVFLFWAYIIMLGLVSGVIVNCSMFARSKKKLKERSAKKPLIKTASV